MLTRASSTAAAPRELSQGPAAAARHAAGGAGVALAALGVVFGDIGTSPIYTVQTAFSPGAPGAAPASPAGVYGIVSLIFWAVGLIVTVKYVALVMNADDDGEGASWR